MQEQLSYAEYLATFLPLFVALFNPAVASFLSRQHWPELATQGITVALAGAEGFAAQFIQGGDYSVTMATVTAFLTYVVSWVARSQFWKDTHTDAKLLAWPRRLPPGGVQPGHDPAILENHPGEHEAEHAA